MLKTALFIVLLIIFNSCRREIQENQVLMSHSWYLASTRIIVYDTATVQDAYNTGAIAPSTVQFTKDTSYVPDPCISQSAYSFRQNNLLSITNNCMSGSPATDNSWGISPGNYLIMACIDDTVSDKYISQVMLTDILVNQPPPPPFTQIPDGLVLKMISSQFVIDQTSTETDHFGYIRNNVQVDSFVRVRVEQYLTFNSR